MSDVGSRVSVVGVGPAVERKACTMTTIVHLEIQIDPSHLAGAAEHLSATLAATRAWPGNEGLEALVDDADPGRVVIVERWATTADHDAYAAWRATPEGRGSLGEILAAPPVKRIYSESLPLSL